MAKGAIGKQNVTNKIKEAFGADFIGEYDKKIYVWTQENGERIQIVILTLRMTLPQLSLRQVHLNPQISPQKSVTE